MRWVFRSALALMGALVIVTACSSFESTAATDPSDGGPAEAATTTPLGDASGAADTSTSPGDDATTPLDAGADTSVPCTLSCRSHQCDDDGGCHPFVFVTNEKFNATFDADGGPAPGIARADYLCNLIADGGTFVALLSDSNNAAQTRITAGSGAHRPLRRYDGAIVAPSYADLFSASRGTFLDAGINQTQTGAIIPDNAQVWTGTDTTGKSAGTCSDWTDEFNGDQHGTFGSVNQTDGRWVEQSVDFCSETNHLYCFELVP